MLVERCNSPADCNPHRVLRLATQACAAHASDNRLRYGVLIAGLSAIGGSFQQVSFSLSLHLMSLKLLFYLLLLLMAVVFGAVLCAPCSLSTANM